MCATQAREKVLKVASASKSYGARKALDNVSLHVDTGEFVALLGPNGAGKTTLFQLLTGLFVADSGDIHIRGHDIRRKPIHALAGIGVVFQQPTLDMDMSVRANLLFHCRLHGLNRERARTRIEVELQRLGLEGRAEESCRALSGGNRRKIELARALLHDPNVLLMDEATVGLDPASRSSLVSYVHELCAARGMGVLWATHLVDEAEQADRVLVLHQGRLLAAKTPTELLRDTRAGSLSQAFLSMTGVSPEKSGER
ncbi:MAG: ABC transporter ATP-binding protein [Gammaproteobacteria bacterium]|nr:ATP-binding cassette domain-containing protein [Gammaproteobacteria bacterium]